MYPRLQSGLCVAKEAKNYRIFSLCVGWRFLPDPDSIGTIPSTLAAAVGLGLDIPGGGGQGEPEHLRSTEPQPSPHLAELVQSQRQTSCLSFLLNVPLLSWSWSSVLSHNLLTPLSTS